MIAKNKKGKSFGGCVRYVLNEGCEILAAEGVLAEDAATVIRDFAIQRSGRPEIKQPVGHIAVSFSMEDAGRMTNDFMLKLAGEYMEEMNIRNTQYIVVRHHNTDHEHFHIVYNRIDNDLKLISVNNDYKRNVRACKKLKDRHSLTYGTGKEKVNRPKFKGADKVKYEIQDQIAAILPKCISYDDLEERLMQGGVSIQYKYRSGAEGSEENIQGVSFGKGGYSFKGSEIDRKFSHANIKKVLSANLNEAWKKMKDQIIPKVSKQSEPTPKPAAEPRTVATPAPKTEQKPVESPGHEPKPTPPVNRNPVIRGIELTNRQVGTLMDGGHIYLENMDRADGAGKFSAYVFLNDERDRFFTCDENPDKMVKCGSLTMRLRDRILVENGFTTIAKVKWWGGIDYQYPYVWKSTKERGEVEFSFSDPRLSEETRLKEIEDIRKQIDQSVPQNNKGPKIRR